MPSPLSINRKPHDALIKTEVSHGIHGREQGTVFMVRLKSHTECSIHVFMVRLNKSHMEYMEESRETEPAVTRL